MKNRNLYLLLLSFFSINFGYGQIQKSFEKRYSNFVKGDYTTIANNVLSRHRTNNYHDQAGNHYIETVFVDIDNDASTFNSSSANLVNPAPGASCLEIKKAYLYWAAADKEDTNEPNWAYNRVKLKLPGSNSYINISGEKIYRGRDTHFSNDPYVCVKDVTNLIQNLNNPFGTYTVANVKAKTGSLEGHGPYGGNVGTSGGWQLVVVYESPDLLGKNITIFDGYAHVLEEVNNFDVHFNNFLAIPYGQVRAKIMYGALEGDQDIKGDALLIQNRNTNNFTALKTPNGDSNNFFSSSITHYDKHFLNRTPASTNTLGFDVGIFDLHNPNNSIINNNQTATKIRMTSNQEAYGLYMMGMSIEEWSPSLNELDLSFNASETNYSPGDLVTFDLEVRNTGNDNIKDLRFETTLPPTVDFVGLRNAPSWIQHQYNNATRVLTITVDNGRTNVGMAAYNLGFELRIKDQCYFLEGVCASSFALQTKATYRGNFNPEVQTSNSSGTENNCRVGNNDPTIVTISAPNTVDWALAPQDLDRTVYLRDTAGLNAVMALQPTTTACNPNIQLLASVFTPNPSCPRAGTYTRTWQFTDGCGRTSSMYTQTISVIDTDMDLDGIYDSCDEDTDGDNCLNIIELPTQLDPRRISTACDTDADGIAPWVDLDDDNDGIYDTNEAANNFDGVLRYSFQNADPMAADSNTDLQNWVLESISKVRISGSLNAATNNGRLELSGLTANNLAQAQAQQSYIEFSFTTPAALIDGVWHGFSSQLLETSGVSPFRTSVYVSQNNFANEALVILDKDHPVSGGTNNYFGNREIPLQANTTYSIRMYVYGANTTIALDNLSIAIKASEIQNTDGTDKADHLDTDSDNDGCADAIEAGHTDSDLDGQLGAAPVQVDGNGVVQNSGGYTGTNAKVTQAIVPLVWQTQPSNIVASIGETINFTAQVTGGDLSYQWQVSINGAEWSFLPNIAPFSNANTASLQIYVVNANLHQMRFRLQTTARDNACSPIAYSEVAQLYVKPQIEIAPATAVEGENLVFQIQLSHAAGRALQFTPSYTHIETNDNDYTPNHAVTIPADATTANITVATNNDSFIENTETFSILLNNNPLVDLVEATAIGTITDNDNLPSTGIQFQTENISVNEDAGTIRLNVELLGDVQDAFSIQYTTQNGTAVAANDYTQTSGSLNFSNSEKIKTIEIPIIDDNWIEATENFVVKLSKTDNVLANILSPNATVNIVDNDNNSNVGLRFNPTAIRVNEDGVKATFQVELTSNVQDAFSIQYTTQDGTALAGSDYTATTGTLTFDNNNKTQTFDVAITNDNWIEAEEQFRALITKDPSVLVNILEAEATATIVDNDNSASAGIAFENTNITIAEDGIYAEFRLRLNADVQDAFSIQYTTADGTAQAGSDYTQTSGTLTFSNANKLQIIRVPITDDTWIENPEKFFVNLSKDASVLVNLLDTQASATIEDNDNNNTVGIAFQTLEKTVNEAAGTVSFTLVLNADVQDEFSIQYTTQNASADAGQDYTQTSGTLNFSNSKKTQTITIPILDDSLVEASENFRIQLSKESSVFVNILTPTATTTILDNDNTNDVGISFDATDISINEAAGTASFTVRLNADVQNPFAISYTTQNNSAQAGSDYSQTTGTLNFSNSKKVQQIEVPIIDDNLIETAEQFVVLLRKDASVLVNIITPQATATIVDNDNLPTVGIAFENSNINITEDGINAVFTLRLNADVQDAFNIEYSSQNGTAIAGSDYSQTTGILSFNNNNKVQTISVPIIDDSAIENTENFLINLSKDPAVLVNLLDTQATANILDNDNLPSAGIAFDATTVTVNENAGSISLQVVLNADVQDAFSIQYATLNGTAEAGSDYTETSGTLNFSNSEKTQTITIPITDDNWIESLENFKVTLSKENTVLVNILTPTATINIEDNDNTNDVGVRFETTDISVNEDVGTATLSVRLTANVQDAFTIQYATQNGTALAGNDYTTATGTLTFNNDNKVQQIVVPILEDNLIEATEELVVVLSKDSAVLVNILTEQASIAINDNDNLPNVGIAIDNTNISINEDEIRAVFTLRLNADVQDAFSIQYHTQDGTALAGSDYSSTSGSISFDNNNKTQTISVPIIDDSLIENNENFFVNLSKDASVLVNIIDNQATATIIDNDNLANVGIEIVDDSIQINEDAGLAEIRVRLTADVQDAFSIQYNTIDASALAGSDYDSTSGSLTFDNNNKEQTIAIPITDDKLIEATESFNIFLSKESNVLVNLLENTATINIVDNDAVAGTGIRFDNTNIVVNEADNTASLQIQLLGLVQDAVAVSYNTANDSATGGLDYTNTSNSIVLDNSNPSQTISIPILEDQLIEATEYFLVNLTTTNTLLPILTPQASIGIVDNDNLSNVGVAFETSNITVDEGAGTINVPVKLLADVQDPFSISFETQAITATVDSDYKHTTGTLNFSNTAKTQTIQVPILEDNLIETIESFKIVLSKDANVLPNILTPEAIVQITDNDNLPDAGIEIRPVSARVNENVGTVQLEIVLNALVQDAFSISYETTDINALAGSDYTATSGTLTFDNNSPSHTISIPIIDDTYIENIERFALRLSKANTVLVNLLQEEAQIEIVDNDNLANVGIAFVAEEVTVNEADNSLRFEVVLNADIQDAFEISYTTQNNSAIAPDDYTVQTGVLLFSNDQKTQYIDIPIINDNLIEATEQFRVVLSKENNVLVNILTPIGTGTIEDDDNLPNVGIAFNTTDITIDEAAGEVELVVALNAAVQDAFSISYTTANVSAIAGADYTAQTGTLNFVSGQTSKTIRIPILEDSLIEFLEQFEIRLSKQDNVLLNILTPVATVNITDNDNLSTAGVAFSLTEIEVDEAAGMATLEVILNANVQDAFEIAYELVGVSATENLDYTLVSGNLQFNNNQKTQTIQVPILEDTLIEYTESFRVLLSKAENVLPNILTPQATVKILDNDNQPDVGIYFDSTNIVVNEDAGTATLRLIVNADLQDGFRIAYSTQNHTASDINDYNAVQGILDFGPDNWIQNIQIPILDDNLIEATEQFFVTLSKDANELVNILTPQATVSILDNDNNNNLGVGISLTNIQVDEAAGHAVVQLSLNAAVQDAFEISYRTVDGEALAGADYTATSGSLEFSNNNANHEIRIPIIDDNWIEATESFTLLLSKDDGVLVNLLDTEATISILDNDNTAGVGIRIENLDITVNENEAFANFKVTLNAEVQDAFSIQYTTNAIDATPGSDYTTTAGSLLFDNANKTHTIAVPIIDDNIIEPVEQFGLQLSKENNVLVNILTPEAKATIYDNDQDGAVGIRLKTLNKIVNEDAELVRLELQLTGNVQGGFEVDYITKDGTAIADKDYIATSNTLRFTGVEGETKIIEIPIYDDFIEESTEEFTLLLSNLSTNLIHILTEEATITIIDNDDYNLLPQDMEVSCDAIPAVETIPNNSLCTLNIIFQETIVGQDDGCASEYNIMRTWSITDCVNNTKQHIQTITVKDNSAPTFVETLPEDTTVSCDAIPTAFVLSATDNCDTNVTVNMQESIETGQSCSTNYRIIRTYTATDCAGNQISHTQTLLVVDTQNPVWDATSLPKDLTVSCDNIPAASTPVATDNCDPNLQFAFSEETVYPDSSCTSNYQLLRTYTASDCAGNQISHTQTITVKDEISPYFVGTLPADLELQCDANIPDPIIVVEDSCDNNVQVRFSESIQNQNDCGTEYSILRTWVATDCAGNSVRHQQTISISDAMAPTFVENLPQNTTVACNQIPPSPTLSATDNCDTNVTVSFNEEISNNANCEQGYHIIRTWTATDCTGNETVHTQVITIAATGPIMASDYQKEISIMCGEEIPDVPELSFSGGCDNFNVVFEETALYPNDTDDFSIRRRWTVTDACNNVAVFEQFVFIYQLETQFITLDLCIEDTPVDLTSLLSEEFEIINGTYENIEGEAVIENNIFSPADHELGTYKVLLEKIDELGCIYMAEYTITVHDQCVVLPCGQDDIKVSRALTPNGDGKNDRFEIEDAGCNYTYDLLIFNRWGEHIYTNSNYQNDWGGSAPNSAFGGAGTLPSGTYYYIIKIPDSGLKPIDGYFYLGTNQ